MPADVTRGLVDTNVLILRAHIPAADLPAELAISEITLAELSAGVHLVVGDDASARQERAARLDVLQRVEHEFDPIPFDARAAPAYGRVSGAVAGIGRRPRRRIADLQIAAVALAHQLALFTTNPSDFSGLDDLVHIVALPRSDLL